MNTTVMNSENSKTSHPHRLLINLTDRIDLQRGEKSIALSNLSIYYTCKNITMIDLKYQLLVEMMNLNYQMDHILFIRYSRLFIILKKNMEKN